MPPSLSHSCIAKHVYSPYLAYAEQPSVVGLSQLASYSSNRASYEHPCLCAPPFPTLRRVMLKVSGEALEGSQGFGIDPTVLQTIASEVAAAASEGVQIAIVVGGGK